MSRKLRPEHYDPRPVEACEVAPHRYRWDREETDEEIRASDPRATPRVRDFLATVPYKKGDVVFVEQDGSPVKAVILSVHSRLDSMGYRQEWFNVLHATRKGVWARAWRRAYPGTIQRGYKLAGLAPEIPDFS